MHNITISGTIAQEVEFAVTANNTPFGRTRLQFDQYQNSPGYISIVGYGKRQDLLKGLNPGDMVVITGNVTTQRVERPSGVKDTVVSVSLYEIIVISRSGGRTAPATREVQAVAPQPAPQQPVAAPTPKPQLRTVAPVAQPQPVAAAPVSAPAPTAVENGVSEEEIDDIPF